MDNQVDNDNVDDTLKKINISLKLINENLSRTLRPFVIFDIRPNSFNTQFLEVVIKNSGKIPAYDVEMKFEPDLDYFGETTLSQLPILKHLPFIEQGLEIRFPYKTFFEVLRKEEKSKNNKSTVKVTYYDCPRSLRKGNTNVYILMSMKKYLTLI
jgi:hypothetical protein